MFRSNPSHNGVASGTPVLTPKLLWNYTADDTIASSPAVVNGVVYIGTDDDNVYALNAATAQKSGTTPLAVRLSHLLLWSTA